MSEYHDVIFPGIRRRRRAAAIGGVYFDLSWVLAGSDLLFDFDFLNNRAYFGGNGAAPSAFLTCLRASPAWVWNVAGLYTQVAANTLRRSDNGLLVEGPRTNVVLWNRDLTNAAWTPTNITAAKDQVGVDGAANSASSITATAGNGTILQTITLASSARFQSAFVKRLTGSGVVEMTMNNGSTWTAVTVTGDWTRVSIPSATLANPTVGFRVVTSGDAIAVDFVQNEDGAYATSPIDTTTVAVERAAEYVYRDINLPAQAALSLYAQAKYFGTDGARVVVQLDADEATPTDNRYLIYRNSASAAITHTKATASQANVLDATPAIAANVTHKWAGHFAENDTLLVNTGDGGTTDVICSNPVVTLVKLRFGASSGVTITTQTNGWIERAACWLTGLSLAEMQAITT